MNQFTKWNFLLFVHVPASTHTHTHFVKCNDRNQIGGSIEFTHNNFWYSTIFCFYSIQLKYIEKTGNKIACLHAKQKRLKI